MSLSQFFMGAEGLEKKCREIEHEGDALGIAFELEKATLQYYNALKEVLAESDILDAVIAAEKAHLTKVMRYIVTDSKFRGLAGGFGASADDSRDRSSTGGPKGAPPGMLGCAAGIQAAA